MFRRKKVFTAQAARALVAGRLYRCRRQRLEFSTPRGKKVVLNMLQRPGSMKQQRMEFRGWNVVNASCAILHPGAVHVVT